MACIKMTQYLAPWTGQNKVCIDILLTELFCYIDTDGAITIVNVTLYGVAEDTIGLTDFLKLHQNEQHISHYQSTPSIIY